MTGEDVDLSWRSQLSGHRYVLTTDAVVARRDQQGFKAVFSRYTSYGRCGPILFRRFRTDGLRRELVVAAKTWAWLVVSTPRLLQPEFRDHWAQHCRLENWLSGGVGATEGAVPLRPVLTSPSATPALRDTHCT